MSLAAPALAQKAPHSTAMRLAGQLLDLAKSVDRKLETLPPPATPSERAVHAGVAGVVAEAPKLRKHLTRWLVDKRPARASVARINEHAWALHRHLDKAPRYRAIFNDWTRVVSVLRRLNKELARR